MKVRYQEFKKATGTSRMELGSDDPFFKATMDMLRRDGYTTRYAKVFVVAKDTVTAEWANGNALRYRLDGPLHDLAMLYVPEPDPKHPPTVTDILLRAAPRPPKDLMDKPVAEMAWRWKQVPTLDIGPDGETVAGYRFEKEWYAVEDKPEAPKPKATPKKTVVRTVVIEQVTQQAQRETILSEEEQ